MKSTACETLVRKTLSDADIQTNGERPWDIQVNNDQFYKALVNGGSLSLGETYMDGWWDCQSLDQLFDRLLRIRLDQKAGSSLAAFWVKFNARLKLSTGWFRPGAIGRRHYDLGNDLFSLMLDKWMNYSCGYWKQARDLEGAQENKMAVICKKLKLAPGMTVLDIGCGWGGLAAYMAEHFGACVTGVTVSKEQARLAQDRCKDLSATIKLMDYRDLEEKFDRVVSVGMFEHVGVGRYERFMKTVRNSLNPHGLFLLHTIGGNRTRRCSDPWISRYIFPNSMLPSSRQITSASEPYLMLEDWHSFGPDYDPTLMAWHRNFTRGWDRIKNRYGNRFFRMWTYYLLACAGSFRARRNQLWQIVFSRDGFYPGYKSER
jgi:cyclopropane-fatty-acyl-phospholipid synthase